MIPWRSPNPLVDHPYPLWVRADSSDGDSLQSQIHEDEYGLRDLIRPGDVVVDCGAYIGAVSALAASLGADVFAVEPLASNAELWRRNTAPWRDKCRIWQGALASSGDVVPLRQLSQVDAYGHRNRFVTMTAPMRPTEAEPVEYATRIDISGVLEAALSYKRGDRRITLLKIDIEGAEWDVLPTIKPEHLDRIDRIAMEVHAIPPLTTVEECFAEAERILPGFARVKTKHNDIFLRSVR